MRSASPLVLLATLTAIFLPSAAAAQVQRSFINLGFELPPLNPNGPDCVGVWANSTVMPASDVPGWSTTHDEMIGWCTNNGGTTGFVPHAEAAPLIDIWKSEKVNGVPSRSGAQHAELNALDASRIYQTVCLLNGEEVSWRFSHRSRGTDPGFDRMAFKINTSAGANVQDIVVAESDALGNGQVVSCGPSAACNAPTTYTVPGGSGPAGRHWMDYSGTFTWNLSSGNYQFGFEAVSSSSPHIDEGNLIDDIQLSGLKPFVELSNNTYSSLEGSTADVAILFSGLVEGAPLVVEIEVIAGSATAGQDYTAPAVISVSIPPDPNGYASEKFSFASQLQIIADSLEEPTETFTLRVRPSSSYLIENTRSCGAAGAYAEATYTILDAHLSVTKTGTHVDLNGNGKADAGDRIDYTITVTNTGSAPLSSVQISDPLLGGNLVNPPATLAVGATLTRTGSHTITQSDMTAGTVSNTATASGSSANGPVQSKTASHQQPLQVEMGLDFVKAARTPAYVDANSNGQIDAGEQVPFDFTITNTGNVDAVITSVTDDLPGFVFQGLSLPIALPVGQQTTFSGYYVVTQANIDAGQVVNGAEAAYTAAGQSGTVRSHAPAGGPQTTVTFPEPPANTILDLTKEITATDYGADAAANEGDTISYRLVVTNNSSLTLQNVAVSDPRLGFSQTLPQLAPWSSQIFGPLVYVLRQQDIDGGKVTNTATATASTPRGTPLSKTAAVERTLDAMPAVDLLKEAVFVNLVGSPLPEPGDRIDYTFTVTNTGNITISSWTISDSNAQVTATRTPPPLPPQGVDSITFVGSRILTEADLNAGHVENVAQFKGTAVNGEPVTATSHGPDGNPTRLVLQQRTAASVSLAGKWLDADGDGLADAGEVVEFTITVTNTGNVTLAPVDLGGLLPTVGVPAGMKGLQLPIAQQIASLPVGKSAMVTFRHVLTQEEIDRGAIYAQVEAVGTGPAHMQDGRITSARSYDPAVESNIDTDGDGRPDYPTEVKLPRASRLAVGKTGRFLDEGGLRPGLRIRYDIVVTNTGNTTVRQVLPQDLGIKIGGRAATGILEPFSQSPVDLAPGESSPVYQTVYVFTEADVANALANVTAGVVNVASATGVTATGEAPEVTPGEANLQIPFIALTKTALTPTMRRGEAVLFSIELDVPESFGRAVVAVRDVLPAGFAYLPGSGQVNGRKASVDASGRMVTFTNISVQPDTPVVITYAARVGASVQPGQYQNRAVVIDPKTGQRHSNEAVAAFEISVEAMFDCSTVLGRVFEDQNLNGYFDSDDVGVAGAGITDTSGLRVETDAHGRFSIPCASVSAGRTGTNYLLKLDPRTLPTGYRIVTENPRHVRLLAGTVSTVDFAVTRGRVVRIDVMDKAFLPGSTMLQPEWASQISSIIEILKAQPSVLRIVYKFDQSDGVLAQARITALGKVIQDLWRSEGGRYRLEVESVAVAGP